MSTTFWNDEKDQETDRAMRTPRVGDRFTEMYSYWVYVLKVNRNRIIYMEAHPPCELPKDGKVIESSIGDFRDRFSYGNIPGYWVRYVDNDPRVVAGWLKP